MAEHVTCQEVVELVTDYLEHALPADEAELFERHINFCDGCAWYPEQTGTTVRPSAGSARRTCRRRRARSCWHALALGVSPPLGQSDAVIEPSVPEGPALRGFVAARIAEERHGIDAYQEECGRQTAWLVERLSLQDAAAS